MSQLESINEDEDNIQPKEMELPQKYEKRSKDIKKSMELPVLQHISKLEVKIPFFLLNFPSFKYVTFFLT